MDDAVVPANFLAFLNAPGMIRNRKFVDHDAAAQYFAASFVMYFCLAVAMEDVEWECELARELDELLAIGWSISLGATLTPADQVALNRKIEFFAR